MIVTSVRRGFASDNHAGAHPEVLAAIAAANDGHAPAYGGDELTAGVAELFRAHFGPDAQAFLVLNGSGANVACLDAVTRGWEAAICTATARSYVTRRCAYVVDIVRSPMYPAFYFLTIVLKTMPVGIAYAIWSGLGIVLISAIGLVLFRQTLDTAALIGLGFIITGVIIVNLFSNSVSH